MSSRRVDMSWLRNSHHLLDIDVDNADTFQYAIAAGINWMDAQTRTLEERREQKLREKNPQEYIHTVRQFVQPDPEIVLAQDDLADFFEAEDDVCSSLGIEPRHTAFVTLNARRLSFAVNVLTILRNVIHPLTIGLGNPHHAERRRHITLLQCPTDDDQFMRYLLIKDVDSFLMAYYEPKNGNPSSYWRKKLYFCLRCMRSFYVKTQLIKHAPVCINRSVQIETFPGKVVRDGQEYPRVLKFDQHFKKYPPKVSQQDRQKSPPFSSFAFCTALFIL